MGNSIKLAIASALILLGIASFKLFQNLNAKAQIGVGYMTKVTCSEVFVAGRDVDEVLAQDFFGIDPLLEKVNLYLNQDTGRVEASLFGLGKSVAVYRGPEEGCTVFAQDGVKPLNVPGANVVAHTYEVDIKPGIQAAIDPMFNDAALPHPIVTRGVVVIQNGKIVAEQYADGFGPETRQQSWSMAKSVTSALTGILVERGQLSLNDKSLSSEWFADDPRSKITLNDLLQMSSGLDTHEVYNDVTSDVVQMLFNSADTGTFAETQAYENPAGSFFEYSSATSNFISKIMRESFQDDTAYHSFPRQALFDPLGMKSAVFELDPAGTFIGSSYIYATARDYARFGQLFLQKGKWGDEQIIPENWVNYSLSAGEASKGVYGAHWWLNQNLEKYPDLPKNVYHAGGNDGQHIIIMPDKNAVIVRLGITRLPATFEDDLYPHYRKIYETL